MAKTSLQDAQLTANGQLMPPDEMAKFLTDGVGSSTGGEGDGTSAGDGTESSEEGTTGEVGEDDQAGADAVSGKAKTTREDKAAKAPKQQGAGESFDWSASNLGDEYVQAIAPDIAKEFELDPTDPAQLSIIKRMATKRASDDRAKWTAGDGLLSEAEIEQIFGGEAADGGEETTDDGEDGKPKQQKPKQKQEAAAPGGDDEEEDEDDDAAATGEVAARVMDNSIPRLLPGKFFKDQIAVLTSDKLTPAQRHAALSRLDTIGFAVKMKATMPAIAAETRKEVEEAVKSKDSALRAAIEDAVRDLIGRETLETIKTGARVNLQQRAFERAVTILDNNPQYKGKMDILTKPLSESMIVLGGKTVPDTLVNRVLKKVPALAAAKVPPPDQKGKKATPEQLEIARNVAVLRGVFEFARETGLLAKVQTKQAPGAPRKTAAALTEGGSRKGPMRTGDAAESGDEWMARMVALKATP